MASYNKVLLMGNLTRDPEVRMTPKGSAVAQFSLALNRKYKDDQGNIVEEVTYVDLEAWGKSAETIGKYCTKGKGLFVEGRLKLDRWEDKTTKEQRSKMKVVVENFQFTGDRSGATASGGEGESADSYERSAPPPRQPTQRPAAQPRPDADIADEVPF